MGKEKIVNLEELSMSGINLSGVEGEILAGGVVKIKKVNLYDTHITTGQVNQLAKKILDEEELGLECLDLCGVNLSGVEAETMAGAVVRLRRVDLSSTRLTAAQVDILIDRVAMEEKLGLEDLDLWGVGLNNVNAGKLARAVVRIKEVGLSLTILTTDQVNVVFRRIIGEENRALERLDMFGVNLRGVQGNLVDLVRAAVTLDY